MTNETRQLTKSFAFIYYPFDTNRKRHERMHETATHDYDIGDL